MDVPLPSQDGIGPADAGLSASCSRRLSLIVTFERDNAELRSALRQARETLSAIVPDYEIILLRRGDATREADIPQHVVDADPRIRVLSHPSALNAGDVYRIGAQESSGELVCFTDASSGFDLSELRHLLPLSQRYDIVSGYRTGRQNGRASQLLSGVTGVLSRILLGVSNRNVDCPLKIFDRRHLAAILPESENGFAHAEILGRARLDGLSIIEVGVDFPGRPAGTVRSLLRDVRERLSALLRFFWMQKLFPSAAPIVDDNRRFWTALLILVTVSGSLLFPMLSYPLIEPDEGRHAEIAREMIANADWVVPTLNHKPYLDKPPMLYWLCATSFNLFGTTDWAARLVPAIAAFLTVLVTYVGGRQLVGTRAAALGAVLLSLSGGFVYCGRFLNLDSLLSLFTVSALLTAYTATVRGDRVRWSWWSLSAICCGLGMLTKGPVALVLLAPPVVAYTWLGRMRSRPEWSHWVVYALVAGGIAVPWFVAMIARNPDYAVYFFWKHNIGRFLSGANHPRSIWFYLPVLMIGFLPWSLLFPSCARFLFRSDRQIRNVRPRSLGFLLLWAGWCVLFFSLSSGKLPTYVLPACPAVALLTGFYLNHILFSRVAGTFSRFVHDVIPRYGAATICWTAIIVSAGTGFMGFQNPMITLIPLILWSLCLIGLFLWTFKWSGRIAPRKAWLCCAAITFVMLLESSHDLIPTWARQRDLLRRSPEITAQLKDREIAIGCWGLEWGSIPFYLQRDDIQNFRNHGITDVADYAAARPRTILILKHNANLGKLRKVLPPYATLMNLGEIGNRMFGNVASARVVLIDVPEPPGEFPPAVSFTGRTKKSTTRN